MKTYTQPDHAHVVLGCGCEVIGALHREVPEVAVLAAVVRFRNFCMKHVMSARLTPRKRARDRVRHGRLLQHGGRLCSGVKLCREKVPGHALWWFDLVTGEPVRDEVWRAWFNAVEELERPLREAQAEAQRQARLRDETYLLNHGWVRHGADDWTAPEEIQAARTYRGRNRYVHTDFRHALNTQRLIERSDGDMTAPPKNYDTEMCT